MRGDQSQSRRSDALDPPGLTQTRGPNGDELLLDLVGEARKASIVEVGRQDRRIVAAVAGDVLGLAIKINGVFCVGLETRDKICRNICKLRTDAGKNSCGELRLTRAIDMSRGAG